MSCCAIVSLGIWNSFEILHSCNADRLSLRSQWVGEVDNFEFLRSASVEVTNRNYLHKCGDRLTGLNNGI